MPALDDVVGVVGHDDGGGDVGGDVDDAGEERDPGEPRYPALDLEAEKRESQQQLTMLSLSRLPR